ncbi:hypothetical protein BC831DRAFT_481449 [Entophlyctis helioformis]|nr:hypothetical protein BC831DRAFT_481449 [Entophlyctis helioformis]
MALMSGHVGVPRVPPRSLLSPPGYGLLNRRAHTALLPDCRPCLPPLPSFALDPPSSIIHPPSTTTMNSHFSSTRPYGPSSYAAPATPQAATLPATQAAARPAADRPLKATANSPAGFSHHTSLKHSSFPRFAANSAAALCVSPHHLLMTQSALDHNRSMGGPLPHPHHPSSLPSLPSLPSLAEAKGNYHWVVSGVESFANDGSLAGANRRKRNKVSDAQLRILQSAFAANKFPSQQDRDLLASQTGMQPRAVQVWFQNRRQSSRRLSDASSSTDAASLAAASVSGSAVQSHHAQHGSYFHGSSQPVATSPSAYSSAPSTPSPTLAADVLPLNNGQPCTSGSPLSLQSHPHKLHRRASVSPVHVAAHEPIPALPASGVSQTRSVNFLSRSMPDKHAPLHRHQHASCSDAPALAPMTSTNCPQALDAGAQASQQHADTRSSSGSSVPTLPPVSHILSSMSAPSGSSGYQLGGQPTSVSGVRVHSQRQMDPIQSQQQQRAFHPYQQAHSESRMARFAALPPPPPSSVSGVQQRVMLDPAQMQQYHMQRQEQRMLRRQQKQQMYQMHMHMHMQQMQHLEPQAAHEHTHQQMHQSSHEYAFQPQLKQEDALPAVTAPRSAPAAPSAAGIGDEGIAAMALMGLAASSSTSQ